MKVEVVRVSNLIFRIALLNLHETTMTGSAPPPAVSGSSGNSVIPEGFRQVDALAATASPIELPSEGGGMISVAFDPLVDRSIRNSITR